MIHTTMDEDDWAAWPPDREPVYDQQICRRCAGYGNAHFLHCPRLALHQDWYERTWQHEQLEARLQADAAAVRAAEPGDSRVRQFTDKVLASLRRPA